MTDGKERRAWCCMNEVGLYLAHEPSAPLPPTRPRQLIQGETPNSPVLRAQIHFGAPWPQSIAATARAKVSDARTLRLLALEGHRFSPGEALQHGLIDVVADGSSADAVLAAARALAVQKAPLAKTGVWGEIKVRLDMHLSSRLYCN